MIGLKVEMDFFMEQKIVKRLVIIISEIF